MSKESPASNSLFLDGRSLSSSEVYKTVTTSRTVKVSDETLKEITASHQLLAKLVENKRIIYGVNTGVGGFINWLIPNEFAQELQNNLIAAVATNVGNYLDDEIVRASILVRLNSLSRGCSAISPENFLKLLQIFNSGIAPCVPSKGSLGASGDLGPLAHIALVATGRWKARYEGKILSGAEALKKAGIEPMRLGFKEGLCLINGTSTMAGFGALLLEKIKVLLKSYDIISCLTFEGLAAKKKPFNPTVHKQKPHKGQLKSASNIWELLKDSQMIIDELAIEKDLQSISYDKPKSTATPIEDAYSIRCTPHILGPIRDSIGWAATVIENEINSSNDNPLIIPEEGDVFHNGHFHGQYLAMVLDHLSISLTTLSNLSDRRIDRFMDKNSSNNLPAFLCSDKPGIRLGLMGGQFMSTSLTAENRSLCHPVSIQTLTSTGDFQDIVSMGLVAARRVEEIYGNTCYIVAFELLCAAQAAEIRGSDLLAKATKKAFDSVRSVAPFIKGKDECLTDHLEALSKLIQSGALLREVEKITGEIEL